jgi:hypothetical protein
MFAISAVIELLKEEKKRRGGIGGGKELWIDRDKIETYNWVQIQE